MDSSGVQAALNPLSERYFECAALLFAGLFVFLAYKLFLFAKFAWLINKMPGPPISIIGLGHIYMINDQVKLGCDPGEALLRVIENYIKGKDEGVFRAWTAHRAIIVCSSPESAEAVLTNNKLIHKNFLYDFLHSWIGKGLLTGSGERWRVRRKLLTPAFHYRILEDFVPIMRKEISTFMKVLHRKIAASQGGVLEDISGPILNCALDTICETAMDIAINAQLDPENDYVRAVHKASFSITRRSLNPLHMSDFIYSLSSDGRDYKKTVDILQATTQKVLDHKKKQMVEEISSGRLETRSRMGFMDTLIFEHLREPENFTEVDIREEVDTFMFEGHDTTGWGVTWATYLLGLHPEVQAKLQEELDLVLEGKDETFTIDDLRELKYLECVIKESLRIYPSVPVFLRETKETINICGYDVPPGASILVPTSSVHRDPRHWTDVETFDPERFMPENSASRHHFAYIPFSAGPRNCVGQKFAMLEEKAMLAALFRNFSVESLTPRSEMRITIGIILKCDGPVRVKLTPRNR